ncbi:MAG: cytochrome oxidase putative small subunit CydP [Methylotenera sp.]
MWINGRFSHLKRLKESGRFGRLAIEISIILIIKILLLWLLWALFFSHPIAKDARQLAVTRMILNHSN